MKWGFQTLSVFSLQRIGYPGNIPGPQHKAGICYLYNTNQTNQSRSPSSSTNQHNHLLAAGEKIGKNNRRNVSSSWPEVPAGVRGVRGVSSTGETLPLQEELRGSELNFAGEQSEWDVRRLYHLLVSVFSLTLGLIIHLLVLLQQTTTRCWEET